jgi:23S rRNA (cytidine1920-2'-O)/16S rRNA (cytidine1409-2'-O)-methyltransferase
LKGLRLDERLVRDGLADSRTRAQALIRAGQVLVDDAPEDKPGTRVRDTAHVRVRGEIKRYASRAGDKLAGALDELGVSVEGRACLDVGASTGGFTDCLLQHGARSVVAVDVGYGQLDARLRADPRVHVRDRTNARHLEPGVLVEPVSLVTADVSFISLRLLLPALARCAPDAEWLLLVKPQFEVGPENVGKGGVVRDDALRTEAADAVARAAAGLGFEEVGRCDSRVAGPRGNREIFVRLRAPLRLNHTPTDPMLDR